MLPGRNSVTRRQRVLLDFDSFRNAIQASIEVYEHGERVAFQGVAFEPFDAPDDVLRACLHALDTVSEQLPLFD